MPDQIYTVGVEYTAEGASLIGTMRNIEHGMTQVHGASLKSARGLDMWHRQLLAVNTTLRYAFAGAAIFGSIRQFQKLADFQVRMGEIAAIAQTGTAPSGEAIYYDQRQLDELADGLIRASTETISPIQELQESARNIASTLQDLTPEEMTELAKQFSMTARVAESETRTIGNAVMTMALAFDRSTDEIGGLQSQFFQVISQSAGMTGDEWARQSGRIVAGAKQAGISLEEMNALMIIMTRAGGTAATNVRHLTQLLMRLRNPPKESLEFWKQLGYTPEKLASTPGLTIISDIFKHVDKLGGADLDKITKLTQAEVEAFEGAENGFEQMTRLIDGPAAQFLAGLTGRIESLRAISSLYTGFEGRPNEGVPGFDQLMLDLNHAQQGFDDVREAFERFESQVTLSKLGNTMSNMFLQAIRNTEVALNPFLEKLNKAASQDWMDEALLGVAGAAIAFPVLRRLPGLRNIPKFGIGGMIGANAAVQGLGSGIPGQDPTQPIFVWIVGSSAGAMGKPFGGLPGPVPLPGGGGAGTAGKLGKLGRFARGAGIVGLSYLVAHELAESTGLVDRMPDALKTEVNMPWRWFGEDGMINSVSEQEREWADKYRKGMSGQEKAYINQLHLLSGMSTNEVMKAMAEGRGIQYGSGYYGPRVPLMFGGDENGLTIDLNASEEALKLLDIKADGMPIEQWREGSPNLSTRTTRGQGKTPSG